MPNKAGILKTNKSLNHKDAFVKTIDAAEGETKTLLERIGKLKMRLSAEIAE